MVELSQTERLLRTLSKQQVDRPPVICTGGMMNAAVVEIMEKTGHTLPEAHHDGKRMAELSFDVHEATGFENFGVPFCMTLEAQILGSTVDFGSLSCEPKIEKERYNSLSLFEETGDVPRLLSSGRVTAVTDAIRRLSGKHPSTPVIATLTGPISLAASIVDPMTFLKELRKNRYEAHRVLQYLSVFLGKLAQLLADSGAHAIAIGDPSATGEILGPLMFREYAVHYINNVVNAVHSAGVPVILHICGDMKPVKHFIPAFRADAISTDAIVNLKELKEQFPGIITMGNVSTYLLQNGDAKRIANKVTKLARDGVDIISPACGLSTSTSLENIRSLTRTAKEYSNNGQR